MEIYAKEDVLFVRLDCSVSERPVGDLVTLFPVFTAFPFRSV